LNERLDVSASAPSGYRAVLGLERYVRSRVDQTILLLVKIRASVVNECAFCVDLHAQEAISAGESSRRVFAVTAWRDAPFFTRRERAALALTDAATRLAEGGVADAVWDEAASVFSEEELADLLLAIAAINTWNRIAVPTRKRLPTP
jgi:AhpD family alkylhydroperoxidase